MSRSAGGQFIFKHDEKTAFIRQTKKVARFCGIKVLNLTVMGNHYHQVLKVPARIKLSDEKLQERIKEYYGVSSPQYRSYQRARNEGTEALKVIREKFLRMMGNISIFQKLLKQRFSIWFNDKHDRSGTLWMGRFKSVLVENTPFARMCVSAYVDLNAVRAGIVQDPKEYRFCGYSMALNGDPAARSGLLQITGLKAWDAAIDYYVEFMLNQGARKGRGRFSISRDLLMKTVENGGRLPVADLFKLRLRFFSDGLAIGSESFLQKIVADGGSHTKEPFRDSFEKLAGGDWQSLRALQQFKKPVIL